MPRRRPDGGLPTADTEGAPALDHPIAHVRDVDLASAVMASVGDGVAVLSADGVLLEANDALCALTGVARERLVGAGPPLHFLADPGGALVAALERLGAGEQLERDLEVRRDGGPPVSARLRAVALGDGAGAVRGHVLALTEPTERTIGEAAGRIASGRLDVAATLRAIADSARRALGADRATCYVTGDDQRTIAGVHTTEHDPTLRAVLERSLGRGPGDLPIWGLQTERLDPLLTLPDVATEPGIPATLRGALGAGALLGVRLEHPSVLAAGRPVVLGALFVSFRERHDFTAAERRAARTLGSLCGLALANARLHAATLASLSEAERRAAVDPLTGLANHRTLQERLRIEVGEARRSGRPLAMVLLDVDRFAAVNEARGHPAGDRLMVELARLLRPLVHPEDLLARVGGDELAWVLPGRDALTAWEAAERARHAVRGAGLGPGGGATISAGVCDLAHASSAEELYRLADGALYWAKVHGRDATCRYSPEVVTALSAGERAERLAHSQALSAIQVLARAVDAKDPSTRLHSERVAELAVELAGPLGWDEARVLALREAGLVHDVGKIGVPDRILFKPGRLDPPEYAAVRQHAALGAQIVADALSAEQVDWVRAHHERFDGAGYPDGLAGEEIPDGARIVAVADAWDVMTNVRPYSAPMPLAQALHECRREAGRQFTPDTVAALEHLARDGTLERLTVRA